MKNVYTLSFIVYKISTTVLQAPAKMVEHVRMELTTTRVLVSLVIPTTIVQQVKIVNFGSQHNGDVFFALMNFVLKYELTH